MSDKFQGRYRIPSARWQQWDYAWNGAYFITICTAGRESCFGRIVDSKMVLSNLGIIADIFWHEITNHCPAVELNAFVVMPNHIHGILLLTGNEQSGEDSTIDDRNVVETRHALSHADSIPKETRHLLPQVDSIPKETRHALSLHHPLQYSMSPGQKRFQNQGKNTISSIIGSYKSAVSKHAHRLEFNFDWQPRFYDHVIRDDDSYLRISAYIQNNPVNWRNDNFYDES